MLTSLLSDNEKDLIDHYRRLAEDQVDFCTGGFVSCDTWLMEWAYSKDRFANVFKDSLILRKPIDSFIFDGDLENEMDALIWGDEMQEFHRDLEKRLGEYNDMEYGSPCQRCLSRLCSTSGFIDNAYAGSTYSINIPGGKQVKVQRGTKIMKTLGKLAAAVDLERDFEPIRLRQSQIMNTARVKAELCISIHPMDFITASTNENGWRSCMNWDDGEYRRGVIEMMNSPLVVVAYVASKHEELCHSNGLPNWNSKRWREFFIVTPELISGIKGYPYWNRNLEDMTLEWLRDLCKDMFPDQEQPYSNYITTWNAEEGYVEDRNADVDTRLHMTCGPAMYNDFYDNDYHTIFRKHFHQRDLYIEYSGASICVVCGSVGEFSNEGNLICDDCQDIYTCCRCNDRIYSSHRLREHHGRYYCEYCYDNLPSCDCCEDLVDIDAGDGIRFDISIDDVVKNSDQFVAEHCICCRDCAGKMFIDGEAEIEKEHPRWGKYWHNRDYIKYTAFTPEGLECYLGADYEKVIQETIAKHKKRVEEEARRQKEYFENLHALESIDWNYSGNGVNQQWTIKDMDALISTVQKVGGSYSSIEPDNTNLYSVLPPDGFYV